MKKIVIGLSGGMDSTTLLAVLLHEGAEVHCCSFTYGSKHNQYENAAAQRVYGYYKAEGFPIHMHEFNLEETFKPFESNLLKSGGEIPEGHYEHSSMKKTVVPGRNLIFASIMAGLAESIGAEAIALGVHAGDHAIYPDCRPGFIHSLMGTIQESSDKTVEVLTPFLHADKSKILEIGYGLMMSVPVPYFLTRTCYKDQKNACGKCGSCQERLEAFGFIGRVDPVTYEK